MEKTRDPVVAGMFYYLDKDNLKDQAKGMLSRIKETPRFRIVVSPHAGYEYSGKTAAHSLKALKEAKTFVILGPNHNLVGPEFSVMDSGSWGTPLGDIEIDHVLANKIIKSGIPESDTIAHSAEHSIEVQLPILQTLFRSFKIVPISIANSDYSESFMKKCESLGKTLAKLMKTKSINLVASSDFSHYISAEEAKRKDELALDRICHLDLKGFFDVLKDESGSVCGYGPIAVAISAARHLSLKKANVLEYTSSGAVTKDYNAVVGYASIGFE